MDLIDDILLEVRVKLVVELVVVELVVLRVLYLLIRNLKQKYI